MVSFQRLFNRLLRLVPLVILSVICGLITYNIFINYPPPNGKVLKNGKLLGGDFFAFYLGGRLYREDPGKLYDLYYQRDYRAELLGEANEALQGELPFVYPPLVAAAISALAALSLEIAFYVWILIGMASSLTCLLFLAREIQLLNGKSLPIILLAALGYLPYYLDTIMGGQLSWMGVCVFSLLSICLLKNKDFLGGAILALGYYKPPLFIVAALYLLIRRKAHFAMGVLFGAVVLTLLTIACVGIDGLFFYLDVVSHYTYGQKLIGDTSLPPAVGMGIFALLTSVFSIACLNLVIYAALLVLTLGFAFYLNERREKISKVEIALLCVASVGLSVQCIKYDLAILLVPFFLLFASRSNLPPFSKWSAFSTAGCFYLEFLAREVVLWGVTVNASSVLFIILLAGLAYVVIREGDFRCPKHQN